MDIRDGEKLQDIERKYKRRRQKSQPDDEDPKPLQMIFPITEKTEGKESRRNLHDKSFLKKFNKNDGNTSTNGDEKDVEFFSYDAGGNQIFVGRELKNHIEQTKKDNAKKQVLPTKPKTHKTSEQSRKQKTNQPHDHPKAINIKYPVEEKTDVKELRRNLKDQSLQKNFDEKKGKNSTTEDKDQLKNYIEERKQNKAKKQVVPQQGQEHIGAKKSSFQTAPEEITKLVDPTILQQNNESFGEAASQGDEDFAQALTQPFITPTQILSSTTQTQPITQSQTSAATSTPQIPTQKLSSTTKSQQEEVPSSTEIPSKPKKRRNNNDKTAQMQSHHSQETTQRLSKIPKEGQKRKEKQVQEPSSPPQRKRTKKEPTGEIANVEDVANENKDERRSFTPRYTAAKFQSIVRKFKQEQKKQVKEMGFGGLLDIDFPQYDQELTKMLLSNFDISRCSIWLHERREDLKLCAEDAHAIYGLPIGGFKIIEAKQESKLDHLPNPTAIQHLEEQLVPQDPPGEFFKTNFLVFAINCLIKSTTSNKKVNTNFMKAVKYVNNVCELDWSQYVIDSLIKSVEENLSYYTGPLPFLMVAYFDRVMIQGQVQKRDLPIISCWKKDLIDERLTKEKKHGFGKGVVIERVTPLLCVKKCKDEEDVKPDACPTIENQEHEDKEKTQQEDEEKASRSSSSIQDFMEELSQVMKNLGQNFSKFGILLEQAQNIFPNSNTQKLMEKALRQLLKLFEKEANEKLSQGNSSQENNENKTTWSQDDSFLASDAVEEMMRKIETQAMRSNEEDKQKEPLVFTPPTFSLGLNDHEEIEAPAIGYIQQQPPHELPNPIEPMSLSQSFEIEQKDHQEVIKKVANILISINKCSDF